MVQYYIYNAVPTHVRVLMKMRNDWAIVWLQRPMVLLLYLSELFFFVFLVHNLCDYCFYSIQLPAIQQMNYNDVQHVRLDAIFEVNLNNNGLMNNNSAWPVTYADWSHFDGNRYIVSISANGMCVCV
jgi:hypothetical protein